MFDEIRPKFINYYVPLETYKRNLPLNRQVAKKCEEYNDNFSETFFNTWIKTIFNKYMFLASYEDNLLEKFEDIHVYKKAKKNWKENIELYKYFKVVQINFVDLVEFLHTPDEDILKLKASVTGIGFKDEKNDNVIEEKRSYYYDIELVKDNSQIERFSDYTLNCPHCGAPSKVDTIGICEHCNESISVYDNVWKFRVINLDI